MQPATAVTANGRGSAAQGYIVKELSVTADLIDSFVQDGVKQEPAASLAQQGWIKSLIDSSGGKVVFSAEGDGHAMAQHLRCVEERRVYSPVLSQHGSWTWQQQFDRLVQIGRYQQACMRSLLPMTASIAAA
jgi:hypothetical protein